MFNPGQRVRLKEDVDTFYVDARYEYPGIDYQEYANIHEPIRLLRGTIALFEGYSVVIPGLQACTRSTTEQPVCDLRLGRRQHHLIEVPSAALEACPAELESTPLAACAKGLRADHPFRADVPFRASGPSSRRP